MAEIKSYFSHDSNARNDEKMIRLRMRHKAAGYGVFFMILERLREEPQYMSIKDYNVIAFDLREDASLIKSVVEDFGLFSFSEDGKYFFSESFKKRMEMKDEKSKKRSEAGKKGMEKRWSSNKSEETHNDVIAKYPPKDIMETELAKCHEELSNNHSWIEAVVMNTRSNGFKDFTIDTFHEYLNRFFAKLQNEGETMKSPKDAMSHFARWLNIELKHEKDKRTNHKRESGHSDPVSLTNTKKSEVNTADSTSTKLTEFINSIDVG